MTREEASKELNIHLVHWKRLLFDKICPQDEGERTINALNMAIKALEQDPCEDAISKQAVLELIADYNLSMGQVVRGIHALPPVTPQPKMGKWIYRKEEDSYRCSLCGFPCHKDNLGAIPTKYCAGCGAVMEV